MLGVEFQSNFFEDLIEVIFDEEEGQILQNSMTNFLTEKNNKKIVNTSFPDSYSSGGLSKYFYCFTVEQNEQTFYCYCLYQRIKDDNMSRGYNQKSVILISQLCLIEFFKSFMLQFFEDLFIKNLENKFDNLKQLLKIQAKDIFEQAKNNDLVLFNMLDKNIEIYKHFNKLKLINFFEQYNKELKKQSQLLFIHHFQIDLYLLQFFQNKNCDLLFTIWQAVLLNKSILIVGDDPQSTSNIAFAITSTIFPIKYQGDLNPYTTISDAKLNFLNKKNQFQKDTIIGCTNPMLNKYQHLFNCYLNFKTIKKSQNKLFSSKPQLLTLNKFNDYLELKVNKKSFVGSNNFINEIVIRRQLLELTTDFLSPFFEYFQKFLVFFRRKRYREFQDKIQTQEYKINKIILL